MLIQSCTAATQIFTYSLSLGSLGAIVLRLPRYVKADASNWLKYEDHLLQDEGDIVHMNAHGRLKEVKMT